VEKAPAILNQGRDPSMKDQRKAQIDHQGHQLYRKKADYNSPCKKGNCTGSLQPVSENEKLDKEVDWWRTRGGVINKSNIRILYENTKDLEV